MSKKLLKGFFGDWEMAVILSGAPQPVTAKPAGRSRTGRGVEGSPEVREHSKCGTLPGIQGIPRLASLARDDRVM